MANSLNPNQTTSDWETVLKSDAGSLDRIAVPGGWLYRYMGQWFDAQNRVRRDCQLIYVPDASSKPK